MKNVFLLSIVVMVLTGSVWFNGDASGNDTISVDVPSGFSLDAKAGKHVAAQLNTAAGDWQELPCKATGQFGGVACQFPQEYAGQQVVIELTWNDVMYVSLVDVPAQ